MKRKGWVCDERSCLLVCSGGRGRDLILCLFRFPDPKGNKRKQSPPHKRGRREDGAARFPRAQIREIVCGSAVATVRFNLLAIQKTPFPRSAFVRLFVFRFLPPTQRRSAAPLRRTFAASVGDLPNALENTINCWFLFEKFASMHKLVVLRCLAIGWRIQSPHIPLLG